MHGVVFENDADIYDYTEDPREPSVPKFPTSSGITMEKANKICKTSIETSTTGRVCLGLVQGFDMSAFIRQCVLDIMVRPTCNGKKLYKEEIVFGAIKFC